MKNIFRKKTVARPLTNAEKVQQAQDTVKHGFSMFVEANELIAEANETLEAVIENDKLEIARTNANLEKAQDELQANKALQEQLKPFIR